MIATMRPFIILLVIFAISASSIGVNGDVKPYFISVYEEGEILPVPTKCPKQDKQRPVHIAHEKDCDKFYKCSHGKPNLQYCPEGLHFNPRKQICDYPWAAGCSLITTTESEIPSTESTSPKPETTTESKTPSTESTSPKPETTTESEIPSTESTSPKPETTTESEIPSTESTSPKPETTTESEIPSTESTSPKPETTTESKTPSTESTSPKPETTTESEIPSTESTSPKPETTTESEIPSTESTTPKPETTSTEPTIPNCSTSCPAVDPAVPTYLPHECVCAKYYKCRKCEQILQECGPGLHFNPTAQKCDLPQNVGCSSTPAPPTPDPIIPGECPATNGDEVVHLPHETKCSLFYKCDNGKKKLFKCSDGLQFNPKIQVCDWPSSLNCKDKTYF